MPVRKRKKRAPGRKYPLESTVQRQFFTLVDADTRFVEGDFIYHVPNGAAASSRAAAARRKAEGQRPGVWDVAFDGVDAWDSWPGFRIEFKRRGGDPFKKLSDHQLVWGQHYLQNDFLIAVFNDAEEAYNFVRAYHGLPVSDMQGARKLVLEVAGDHRDRFYTEVRRRNNR